MILKEYLENLILTGQTESMRDRIKQRIKNLASFCKEMAEQYQITKR